MKSNFNFRFSGFLYLMMCILLLGSCSTETLETEEMEQRSPEKINAMNKEDSALETTKTYTDNSCETICVLEGGWDIPKKRGYKSVNVGPNTKEMSYTVYNTDSHFVVEVLYEITAENAKVDAQITITVNGNEKITERVKSGSLVTQSFPLPADYRPCDVLNYHIKQVAYGEPVIFEGEYKLIPTCMETEPTVGQKRYGGIIVYILQPGDPGFDPGVTHGLVQAPFTLAETLPWSEELMYSGTSNNSIGGGMENTLNIVAFQGEGNYAAKACSDLVVNGYDDWYLPNQTEIYYGQGYIDYYSYDPYIYWTSTSMSPTSAKPYSFDPFAILPFAQGKQTASFVLPFRSF